MRIVVRQRPARHHPDLTSPVAITIQLLIQLLLTISAMNNYYRELVLIMIGRIMQVVTYVDGTKVDVTNNPCTVYTPLSVLDAT